MENARGRRISLKIEATSSQGEVAMFQASGNTIDFAGFLRAYVEGSDDPASDLANQESLLPDVQVGEALDCKELEPQSHTTRPPARYTEATLTRTLEQDGIGRPSTYATIIDTILNRNYVSKRGNALAPTWTAMAMINLMEKHLSALVDYQFTARMEDDLDAISRGEADQADYLREFYFGGEHDGLKKQVEKNLSEIDVREICRFEIGRPETGESNGDSAEMIYVRVGKYGPFLEQGERRGRLPEDLAPDEVNVVMAVELLDQASQADEPLGICPDRHKAVYLKTGRFGPYVQLGDNDDADKKNASLLPGMSPEEIDLEMALKLLELPRTIGEHPESSAPIIAHNGRYGPFIKCGDETRSLPEGISPLEVTLVKAVELLAQPKTRGRGFRQAKEPLKVFEASPVTGEPIKLLDGRYGPYVADGETNASLPKSVAPDEVTFDQAVELLAVRKAKGGGKKKFKKKSAKKKPAKKKAAKKRTVKKKKSS